MKSYNLGVGHTFRIAVEFVALAILLLAGSAGAVTPIITNHQPSNISNDHGNRIWDGSRPDDFALTYSWNPMSFSGFYYNAKDDAGTEKMTMTLGSYTSRTIATDALVYSTSPQEVSFARSGFGKYQVMGFMADKYFAGALSRGELHKVLIDDDVKRTISVGGTLALQDGYVLNAKAIDLNNRTMLMSLLKDGTEVDMFPLSADETHLYSKNVSGIENLPLIMVRFDSVFSGQEVQVAFIKGLFQISEDATIVKPGNQFGNMEVTSVSQNGIEMINSADIGLNKGTTADIMGDVKIKVADNDSVVRFALSVEKTGSLEVRSTVYRDIDITPITEWTPYNFGMNIGQTSVGFFYDLDDGAGNEKLTLTAPVSGRNISDKNLEYSTSPREVKFTYTGFGKYQVIGFMADKYFAGYTSNTRPSNPRPSTDFSGISTFSNGTLYKVLADDDTRRMISVGNTIALKEGYAIKAEDIDLNARTMLLSILKDGKEVDISPISMDETYVYSRNVSGIENLPLIMVRVDSVFSGQEVQGAFLKGLFQISEDATVVQNGTQIGKMEVTGVSYKSITMSNNGSIRLDKNKNDTLMGNIRLKVADNDTLRFYFSVEITPEIIANLPVNITDTIPPVINSVKLNKSTLNNGDAILITVNATDNIGVNTVKANGASLTVQGGNTFTWSGTITAIKDTHSVNVSASDAAGNIAWNNSTRYTVIAPPLPISDPFFLIATPLTVISGTPINVTFTVLYGRTLISGATVILTGNAAGAGTTDSKGNVTISVKATGAGAIAATVTKAGYANTTYSAILTATMPAQASGVNAEREIEKESLSQGESTNITIRINSNIIQGLSLKESIPAGWNLTRISDNANGFKNDTNEWVWLNVTSGITKTVIYAITAPTGATPGTYYINGTISNSSGVIAVAGGNNIITFDILTSYRRLGSAPDRVETTDLLKAMEDWRSKTAPAGFINPITNQELLALMNEWAMS